MISANSSTTDNTILADVYGLPSMRDPQLNLFHKRIFRRLDYAIPQFIKSRERANDFAQYLIWAWCLDCEELKLLINNLLTSFEDDILYDEHRIFSLHRSSTPRTRLGKEKKKVLYSIIQWMITGDLDYLYQASVRCSYTQLEDYGYPVIDPRVNSAIVDYLLAYGWLG